MSESDKKSTVGTVETRVVEVDVAEGGFVLDGGSTLKSLSIAYEAYGELSPSRDNVIFICHALTGDAHVAGYHDPDDPKSAGWWEEMVGPGKGIDTDHYHVVCANILGGCKGTTGPSSENPDTGRPYGSSFPDITVGDIVNVHKALLDHLGIERLAAVIGGSLGGIQAIEWCLRYPEMISRCICVASAANLSAQSLAFDIIGRQAIVNDPDWHGGDYYDKGVYPAAGLTQARQIGHVTYLSKEMMTQKFGRERHSRDMGGDASSSAERSFKSNFQIESYLDYQGGKFVERFDANSYLHITKALDDYDLVEKYGSLETAFTGMCAKFLIVALSADWLFTPEQSQVLANALLRSGQNVSYCELHAPHGHDAFLVDIEHLSEVIRAFLPWVNVNKNAHRELLLAEDSMKSGSYLRSRKAELDIIRNFITPGSRIVDLGCGNGELLSLLKKERKISGLGLDIDIDHVIQVIDRGHDVFQRDVDAGMAMVPDNTYDYAILGETLQVVKRPRDVLREMLRVAREGIVSFPNFGKYQSRLQLAFRGRMPKNDTLPFDWYNTPNIHLFTLKDFRDLCRKDGIEILDIVILSSGFWGKLFTSVSFRNLGADRVLVKIALKDKGK